MPVLNQTIVEIQINQLQFGATLWLRQRDGNSVNQFSLYLDLKNAKKTKMGKATSVQNTEVAKIEQDKD